MLLFYLFIEMSYLLKPVHLFRNILNFIKLSNLSFISHHIYSSYYFRCIPFRLSFPFPLIFPPVRSKPSISISFFRNPIYLTVCSNQSVCQCSRLIFNFRFCHLNLNVKWMLNSWNISIMHSFNPFFIILWPLHFIQHFWRIHNFHSV